MASPVFGQETTASIFGRVTDTSGAVIPGVDVVLRSLDTGRTYRTITDETGSYAITRVPNGSFEAEAELTGFKKSVVTDIVLRVNDRTRINFALSVGELTEEVTVAASTITVDTASGTTSNIMVTDDIIQLPTNGRNVMPLAMIMPGVVSDRPNDRRANRHAVNGVRPTHNAWLLDGGYNIDTGGNWSAPLAPNIETVSEFRAIRGNYSAEFGMGAGAQFNVLTKSGTNEFHGSGYWFHRNDVLNARDFFEPEKSKFRHNDFGATVGGPIIKERTFFFVLWGNYTERAGQTFFSKIPELPYRTGDFSSLGVTIIDPETGEPFPNNIIPSNRIDPNAQGYIRMYPNPNYSDSRGNNYFGSRSRKYDQPQVNFRIDHFFNDNHRIMGRYVREERKTTGFDSPGFESFEGGANDRVPANNTVINFYSTFSPTFLNEFNFTRSHNRIIQFNPPAFSRSNLNITIPELVGNTTENYPIDSLNLSEIPDSPPGISLVNYQNIAPAAPWSNWQSIFDYKDNMTWIRGNHNLKFGFDYAYEIKFEPADTNVFGDFSFDGRFTGDAFADFLLGLSYSYAESSGVGFNDNRRNALEFYVDDTWRASSRLTLNLGVRYSYFPPATEKTERFRAFNPAVYDRANAVTVGADGRIVPGSGDPYNGLINPKDSWDYSPRNFAPRLGFSYDVFGSGRTAFRGGYGMFYSREILGAFILMSSNPPFQERLVVENAMLADPSGGNTVENTIPLNISSIDLRQHIPVSHQWNLNIQHALFPRTVLEVGYSGSRTYHMMRSRDINRGPFSVDAAGGSIAPNALRPFSGWGTISHREQSYNASYHGLQIGLNRNFADGLGVKAAYTWSKAIDNADFTGGIYGVSPYYPNDQYPDGERGPANFDATQRFVSSVIYDLPWMRDRSDIAGQILGGWNLSVITTFQDGLPYTIGLGRDRAGIGYSTRQRPNLASDPAISSPSPANWFDTGAFYTTELGTLGDLGRNTMRLPGTNNWDFALTKTVSFHEDLRLNVRIEAFNVWNHTQFAGVGSNFSSSSFGRITSAQDPRTMQIGLRLLF